MRIGTRVWLLLVVLVIVVLGASTLLRTADQREILGEALVRDRQFLGDALRASVARSTQRELLQAVQSLLESPRVRAAHVSAQLVDVSHGIYPGRLSHLTAAEEAALTRGEVVVDLSSDAIVTVVPLLGKPGTTTAVELVEPPLLEAELLKAAVAHSITAAAALALSAGLTSWLLVRWLVTRPLIGLGQAAQKIAGGQFDVRVPAEGKDEVADFAREMNTMAQKLMTAHQRIEEESSARVATLEALRHADRLRTVGQLAAALAHELGTPLNVVSGHARLIERADETGPDSKQSARLIVEQANRMANLIKTLLGFARRQGAERKLLAATAIANKAVGMLDPMAHKLGVRLRVDEAKPELFMHADESQILQAVTNLIVNAMQVSPNDEIVTVQVDGERARAPADVGGREGPFVRIAVVDHGGGLAPDVVEHMFEPFFTTKRAEEGTGLGLPVAQGIARDHGGWISVDRANEHGTRFTIHLPAAEPPSSRA
jgi:two-component system, NtrC family, sensor kinase